MGGNMAKRFTDTSKWKNPWFRALPTKYKILFLYLLDECDNAGVIYLDWELISFILKEEFGFLPIDHIEFKKLFSDKIVYLADDKIIIKNFITYQDNLNNPNMRKHIEKLMRSHGIFDDYNNENFS
jgi:hypothetical protein